MNKSSNLEVVAPSHNKRVYGSLRSPKCHRQTYISPRYYLTTMNGGGTSHTRQTLGVIHLQVAIMK